MSSPIVSMLALVVGLVALRMHLGIPQDERLPAGQVPRALQLAYDGYLRGVMCSRSKLFLDEAAYDMQLPWWLLFGKQGDTSTIPSREEDVHAQSLAQEDKVRRQIAVRRFLYVTLRTLPNPPDHTGRGGASPPLLGEELPPGLRRDWECFQMAAAHARAEFRSSLTRDRGYIVDALMREAVKLALIAVGEHVPSNIKAEETQLVVWSALAGFLSTTVTTLPGHAAATGAAAAGTPRGGLPGALRRQHRELVLDMAKAANFAKSGLLDFLSSVEASDGPLALQLATELWRRTGQEEAMDGVVAAQNRLAVRRFLRPETRLVGTRAARNRESGSHPLAAIRSRWERLCMEVELAKRMGRWELVHYIQSASDVGQLSARKGAIAGTDRVVEFIALAGACRRLAALLDVTAETASVLPPRREAAGRRLGAEKAEVSTSPPAALLALGRCFSNDYERIKARRTASTLTSMREAGRIVPSRRQEAYAQHAAEEMIAEFKRAFLELAAQTQSALPKDGPSRRSRDSSANLSGN